MIRFFYGLGNLLKNKHIRINQFKIFCKKCIFDNRHKIKNR